MKKRRDTIMTHDEAKLYRRKSVVTKFKRLTTLILTWLFLYSVNANAEYQSDRVFLEALHPNVIYNINADIFIYERGCLDSDTCTNGQRDKFGHLWFVALGANLADKNGNKVGYMHGGFGNGNGISSDWFVDWSGYDNLGNAYPNSQGHHIKVHASQWYRMRIWRSSWDGTTGCWGFYVKNISVSNSEWESAGNRCVQNAFQLTFPHQFVEIAEDDPCTTDIWGVHSLNQTFRDHDGHWYFSDARISYEDNCSNTNLKKAGTRYWIDDRQSIRQNRSGDYLW